MIIFELEFFTLDDKTITRTITSEDYYFAGLPDIEMWGLAVTIGTDMATKENMFLSAVRCIAC